METSTSKSASWTEGRLRRVLDRLPEAILVVDRGFHLRHANAYALELMGRPLEGALGLSLWDLLPHLKQTDAWHEFPRALSTGTEARFCYLSTLTGRWLEAQAFPEGEELVIHTTDLSDARVAEEDLKVTQEWLGLALKGGQMGWWRRDLITHEVVWSPELEKIFGLEPGSFDRAHQSFLDFVHPDDRGIVVGAVGRALETGEEYVVEFRFRRVDGSEGWMEGRGRAFFDDSGKPVASYGLGVNITERKAAEEAVRRGGETFVTLVQNSPFGVYAVDADFRLVLVSQGAKKIFENIAPLLGRDFAAILRTVWEEPFASETIRHFKDTLETGEPYHAPSTVEQRQDVDAAESYDWKIERIAMPDGRFGVVCHFYDLSERQRYEAELERRVEERTEALTRANRDLDQFAYSVAHDLRAPLRTIVSTSRLVLEDAEARLTEDERRMLQRQVTNSLRLARIVDDLLGFARLAQSELNRADFDLTGVAGQAVAEVAGREWECPPTVEIQAGMQAHGDASLLGYALINLLDNAFKFSPDGGMVQVGQQDGVFFVRDQGIGFDMQYAHKLFIAFERLVGQETFSGTGVGLANVKRIVERHSGQVWAEAEPERGSTFFFTLG